ncbi:uncharacterized protein LOC142236218 [Haematobia irritans]|uniref:uncharacterized protein LOC142236218 n=1 Tax=Haematobia irritans TaxID=7368 RepID=UPI003F502FFF
MKFILIILVLATVVQTVPRIQAYRVKRDSNEGKQFYSTMLSLIDELKVMIEGVLHDMPNTEAYARYKLKWNLFLEKYNHKAIDEECAIKIVEILEEFADFADDWRLGKLLSPECQTIKNLFLKYGYVELSEKFLPIIENLVIPEDVMEVQVQC